MKNLFKENQLITIVPEDIEGAQKARIAKVYDDTFSFENIEKTNCYSKDGKVNGYFFMNDGIVFFDTKISDVSSEDKTLKLNFPESVSTLQRRQYSRIAYEQFAILNVNGEDVEIKTIDLSAGGMQFLSHLQLETDSFYVIDFNINNQKIRCDLLPIRVKETDNGMYTISGKFINLPKDNKVILIQYCLSKQLEQSTKKYENEK